MKLSARLDRDDVASVMDLIERPIERRNELAGGRRFKRDFMLNIGRGNEDEAAANFDFRRCFPEITLTHAYSPDSAIRQEECDSFVITGNLTQISVRATTHCPLGAGVINEVPALAPFSIARTG